MEIIVHISSLFERQFIGKKLQNLNVVNFLWFILIKNSGCTRHAFGVCFYEWEARYLFKRYKPAICYKENVGQIYVSFIE